MNRMIYKVVLLLVVAITAWSCRVSYSFTGASIAPEVKTFSIQSFTNTAAMSSAILTSRLTDDLADKFARQTSLVQVSSNGDFAFEGRVTGYSSTPMAITSEEFASANRLTITIEVKFTNKVDPKQNFTKTFSRFEDYDSSVPLQTAETTLIPSIVEQLITDIFNASASNW